MPRIRGFAILAASVAVLASGLGPSAAPALAADQPGACATTPRTLNGALGDGATYKIQVPANWNCTLFLYSHGYAAPGWSAASAGAADGPSPEARTATDAAKTAKPLILGMITLHRAMASDDAFGGL